jgi:hypothetical protein
MLAGLPYLLQKIQIKRLHARFVLVASKTNIEQESLGSEATTSHSRVQRPCWTRENPNEFILDGCDFAMAPHGVGVSTLCCRTLRADDISLNSERSGSERVPEDRTLLSIVILTWRYESDDVLEHLCSLKQEAKAPHRVRVLRNDFDRRLTAACRQQAKNHRGHR